MIDRVRAVPWWARALLGLAVGAAGGMAFMVGSWALTIGCVAALSMLVLPAPSWWQAALTGFCFGLTQYLLGVTWLSVIFVEALFGLAALEACFSALLAVLLRWSGRTPWWPPLAAGCWLAVEYAFSHFPFEGFPWLRLGYLSVDSPLAGLLPLVGVPGATFALALAGQFVAWAVLVGDGPTQWVRGLAGVVAVLCTGLLGLLVPAGAETGSVSVGYVQGNAPGGGIYGLGEARTITRNHVAETQRLAGRIESGELPRPDFVVWPENGTDMDPFADAQTNALVKQAVAAVGVPVLIGTITDGPGVDERQTAAIVWDPATGAQARYDKRNLVPFGEWVPLRSILEPLFPVVRYVGAQSVPGTGPGVLPIDLGERVVTVGDLICYEVAYDATVHDTVRAGAQLSVVQSSNAMYVGTGQVAQQFRITRARAAELRRDILVVTTTGTSGLIRPDGSVAFTLPEFEAASGVVELPLRSGLTPAVLVSGWLELAGIAVTVLGLAVVLWRRRGDTAGAQPAQGHHSGRVRQNGQSEANQETQ
ncbi:apolipoprotein N-acyltransferase [Micropruina sonneratiae]|uniref:apolipoprotein N-acyltransferase n=1 Tax=Micropruina sonneratiae TaxID=2986940 RepID=UPI0022279964|nr:apolipoprotein N-acyltransferase [Micropruina sp. KQZ13P-5]MCW3157647.1 apolipoprotein N-acyltransferase [Micropruina sp. KQZ13P-5]